MSLNDRICHRVWMVQTVALVAGLFLAPPSIWATESHLTSIAPKAAGCDPAHFTVAIDVGHGAAALGAISARLVQRF
jgi:hypothetical protein